ncbi:hypothetical protein EVAR_97514_1 [Eumeta japonica]|uniref:Uncharacterized protein n=1 Tax=Eumeta variegata TaxID=151549 RepID=A0A4C1WPN3_EUMVA|nr:hypothetical protein EVAR_97514_1 [Eumeta japonica]
MEDDHRKGKLPCGAELALKKQKPDLILMTRVYRSLNIHALLVLDSVLPADLGSVHHLPAGDFEQLAAQPARRVVDKHICIIFQQEFQLSVGGGPKLFVSTCRGFGLTE